MASHFNGLKRSKHTRAGVKECTSIELRRADREPLARFAEANLGPKLVAILGRPNQRPRMCVGWVKMPRID